MARTRSPAYDDQREMILARAAELFAAHGYAATSMNGVASACGLSKPTLYHYYRDKDDLLVHIADGHVSRLVEVVREVEAENRPPRVRLRRLVTRFVEEYADAQHAHRVLTEDVRFLDPKSRRRILDKQREVVEGFTRALAELRPELTDVQLTKPLAMLLFGMINWMFTWFRPDGPLDYDAMAPIVADLFLNGLRGVKPPRSALPMPR